MEIPMQFHHSLLAAAVLAVVSTSAFGQAATGAVGLRGQLVPNSCSVTIANGGTYNIGALRMSDLNATNPVDRGLNSNVVTLACSGGTLLALHVSDNQDGTALGTTSADFGLGNATTSGAPVGSYKLNIPAASVLVDAVAAPVIASSDLTTWATTTATSYWPKSTSADAKYRAFGPAAGPLSFTSASFALEVLPTLNSRSNLLLDTTQSIDGSATIEVHYL
jgi:type 1 fimbria pilin